MSYRLTSMRPFALLALLSFAPAATAEEILVFAAASATDALQEIGADFHRATGHDVRFSFGSSGALARQIAAGAPADVFLSADTAKMDELERAGLVRREDRVKLLSNQLVVVVPAGAPTRITAPSDLTGLRRIAVGDPQSVPAGIYARKWLESLGLWSALESRIIPTLDVRAALAAVETEAADAGLVYKTDAAISRRVRIAYSVPRESGPAITYPVARIVSSKKKAAADFVKFLSGEKARATFTRLGFVVL